MKEECPDKSHRACLLKNCPFATPVKVSSTPSTEQEMREKLYGVVDSFLAEASDQNGNFRNLDRLNKDRHLAVDRLLKLLKQEKVRWENDELTDEELENSSWYKAKKLMWAEDLKQELFPDDKTDMASYGWIINVLDGLISNLSK